MAAYQRENSSDLAAFERIMTECERRVLRIALRLLNNPQDAQDAAQEVFLRLYKHLDRLDETRGYEAWLFRVSVNVCRDMGRTRRRSVALEEVPDGCLNDLGVRARNHVVGLCRVQVGTDV